MLPLIVATMAVEPSWIVRPSAGVTWVSSEEEQLLRADEYRSVRGTFSIDASAMIHAPFGAGVFGSFSTRSITGKYGGPTLDERIGVVGVTAPLVFAVGHALLFVAPRVGYARGSWGFHGRGALREAFAFGAEAGFLSTEAHVGFSIGWLRAVTKPIGEVDRPHDLGGGLFALNGWFGG